MTSMTYPLHVDARLDAPVSRGLWLVKWLLALPHYVVLAFLWVAFGVLSLAALVAILVTGRYPRALFDFNVGVLRWHWRVAYYAYGALGTDRYPPFTLRDVPDYPAHLEVDYPARLSRGLVLVKWLLAVPHFLVVGLLVGGVGYAAGSAAEGSSRAWATGLIPLLVLVAGAVLLVTGRYPQPLFDLVLGLNRWVLRVAGYAALMTDTYPPFRLDQGGPDQTGSRGVDTVPPAPPTPPAAPPAAPPSTPVAGGRVGGGGSDRDERGGRSGTGWSAGRVLSVVVGSVVGVVALGLAASGTVLAVADRTARDADGFFTTPSLTLRSDTYAVVSEDLDLPAEAPPDLTPAALLGDALLRAEAAGGNEVFVGLGPADDVRAFLAGVEHDTVSEVEGGDAVLRTTGGGAPMTTPASETFWAIQASGTGEQELRWTPEDGDWVVVVMSPDASAGVAATVTAGAELAALPWVVGILLSLGGTLLVIAALLVAVPVRAVSRERVPGVG